VSKTAFYGAKPEEGILIRNKPEHQIIKMMPKIELHLHLEGAFTFESLFGLLQKYGGDPQIKSPSDLEKKFVFRDFEHFLELWFWKNQYFREPIDFEDCAYKTLENLSHQNVIYCEMFYSPWDFVSDTLSVEAITEATLNGIHRAQNAFPITCNLIADLVRDYDSSTAVERVHQILPYKDKGVIGIGLGGSEQQFPAKLFTESFDRARDLGFHLTAHAGEAAGPQSVWETIQKLKVERIGHGVRSIEDRQLINYLRDHEVPLEVCVNSNLKTKIFSSPKTHPVKHFIEKGLIITINTDDPSMFGATLTEEFIILLDEFDISLDTIRQFTLNAINSAFISPEMKEKLKDNVRDFWSAL
jgi:adenosine deaminase